MNIGIKNSLKKQRLPTAAFAKKLENLLRSINLHDAELSVLFVGDRAMRSLNRRYRKRDSTTDVLAFPLQEKNFPGRPFLLGDIVISVPAAQRQAAESDHGLNREIHILLVHGLLHLLGYDHEAGDRQARRMRRKEIQLLKRFF